MTTWIVLIIIWWLLGFFLWKTGIAESVHRKANPEYDKKIREEWEKPYLIKNCEHFETCKKGQLGCKGCNIWNLFYDTNTLREWCIKNGKSFSETVDELEQDIVR